MTPLLQNQDNDLCSHHPSTQNHCEQLLMGWELVPPKNSGTAWTNNRDNKAQQWNTMVGDKWTKKTRKKAQEPSNGVSWAIGKFFLFTFLSFTNKPFFVPARVSDDN